MTEPAPPCHAADDAGTPPRAAARPHRPRRGPRGGAGVLQGADRARHRRSGCSRPRPPTSASAPDQFDPPLEIADGGLTPAPTASWRWSSAATARSCAPPSSPTPAAPRCWASTSATSGSSPRPSTTTSSPPSTRSSHRRYTTEDRLDPRRRACYRDGEVVDPHLRAERGQRREGRPASGCSRWSSRSTAGRCPAGAATASSARRRPARRRTTSAPAVRSCGPGSRRC